MEYIGIGLGLKGDVFEKMFGVAVQAIRMNYYPPCSRPGPCFGSESSFRWKCPHCASASKGSPVGLQILKEINGCLLIQFQMLLSSTWETQ
ncbi:protein SRG1 [Sesbania bispinosa]|nr:protein SRG1 [Sesbania bispinosa]